MTDPLHNLPDDDASLDLPAGFKAQLRAAHEAKPPTKAQWSRVDAAMEDALIDHFAKQPDRTVIGRICRWAGGIAAAAAFVFAVWYEANDPQRNHPRPKQQTHQSSDKSSSPIVVLAGDVNRDGRVDILDAYLLQRRIESAKTLESAWDLTRDGRVDAQDVDAIAIESVRLEGGRS